MTDLPPLILLTDRHAAARHHRSVEETVRLAVLGGATAVLVREKDLPAPDRQKLATALTSLLPSDSGRLGIASDVALAANQPRPWVHLAQRDVPVDRSSPVLVGRSCHTANEVRLARDEGCDYVTISPVDITDSKPGYGPALGADGVRCLVHEAGDMPVWVLGGVTPDNVDQWLCAGARGIAVMGGVMGAVDPHEATVLYLHALGARR